MANEETKTFTLDKSGQIKVIRRLVVRSTIRRTGNIKKCGIRKMVQTKALNSGMRPASLWCLLWDMKAHAMI